MASTEKITSGCDTQKVESVATWRCTGYAKTGWCNYLITDTEMQAHKFDLGCPRCKKPFADFELEKDS